MKVEYNRQGAARKELVQAISAITGEKAKVPFSSHQGLPDRQHYGVGKRCHGM
jgi:hypothetical protein